LPASENMTTVFSFSFSTALNFGVDLHDGARLAPSVQANFFGAKYE